MRRSRRGTTLVEAMMALAVMAVGLAGIVSGLVATTRQDRRNSSRAYAQTVANELARQIGTWDFADPRLSPVNNYAGTNFSKPTVNAGFTVVQGTPTTVTETLTPPPDYNDTSLGLFGGRSIASINSQQPGQVYGMARYWNVIADPTNPMLKLVAVHVTYSLNAQNRGVATAYTSVMNKPMLIQRLSGLN